MPPGAIAACTHGCGVWVNAEASRDAFVPAEIAKSRLTTWFRERVSCPHCSAKMSLRGYDMSLFQGCDDHGFWIDDETVGQTGLARPAMAPLVQRAREAAKTLREEVAKREADERAAQKAQAAEDARLRALDPEQVAKRQLEEHYRQAERRRVRLEPYIQLVRTIAFNPNLLADYLLQLEEKVTSLQQRVDELERR
jgi:hypothetical protein